MVQDDLRTKAELVEELRRLRARIAELEQAQRHLDRAEEALRISDNQLRDIFENLAVGVYRTTPDGRILMANPAIVRMLGYSSFEELAKRNLEEEGFEPRYERSIFKERIEKDGYVIGLESAWIRRDGTELVVLENARAVRDEHGKTLYYEGTAEDITERKLAENETKSLKRQLEFILGATKTGLDIIDSEFNVRYVDPQWAAVYGDYRGKKCYEYFAGVNSVCPACGIPQALKTKQTFVAEQVLPKENNRPIQVVTVPFQDEKGEWLFAEVNIDITEQRKAALALRDSEEMLRAIFDATTESILLLDNQATILAVNKTAAQRFGRSVEELVGLGSEQVAATVVSPEVVKSRIEQVRTVVESGKPVRFEDERQGIIFDTAIYPVFDAQGKVSRLAVFGRDITEQRRAKKALEEAKLRYQSLFENAPVGIGVSTPDGWVLECNSTMLRITGYSEEELRRVNLSETYLDPEDRRILRERLHTEGAIHDYKVQLKRKDGSPYYAMLTVVPFTVGGQDVFLTVQRDITERMKMEAALRASEEKYRTLVDSAGESIAVVDDHGTFLFMNTTAAETLAGKPEDYIGKTMWDVFPPQLADRHAAAVREVIRTGIGANNIALDELQGRQRWYNTTTEPLRDGSGKIVAAMIVARDIHDLKQAQTQLEQYRENMIRAEHLASVGTLSATVAHELTQPLTIIRLSIEGALAKMEKSSRHKTVVKKLKDSLEEVSNITSIVERFRDFARKSSEKAVRQVDVKVIAERTMELLSERARQAWVNLRLKGMDKLPPIHANQKDVEQMFFALVENAIQAADGKRQHQVIISGLVKGDQIQLRFADDCGGIAPENLDKIFEPFFSTKPPGEGTGLGLCIVQSVTSRAGGKIHVRSKPGKGSTFLVTLPIKAERGS